MSKTIIRGGTIVTAVDTVLADVLIDGEKIAGVGLYPSKGTIAPGADADIVIFDPAREHVFSTATSLMNVDYDLREGRRCPGRRGRHSAGAASSSTTARSSRAPATAAS
jgi:dihydroorotase-like cyclic amidohydrolase